MLTREFTGTIAVACLDLMTVIAKVENTEDNTKVLCQYLRVTNQGKRIQLFTHCLRCLLGLQSTQRNASNGKELLYEAIHLNRVVVLTMEDQNKHGCERCQQHLHTARTVRNWRINS